MPHRRNLLTFGVSLMTLVMAISITAAAPISASGELTRPVTIANTGTNPAVTQDTSGGGPGRSEIVLHCSVSITGGAFVSSKAPVIEKPPSAYVVPAGKRLIVEGTSLMIQENGADTVPVYVQLDLGSPLFLDFKDYGVDFTGLHRWSQTQLVRSELEPGTGGTCQLMAAGRANTSTMSAGINIVGYLVPAT